MEPENIIKTTCIDPDAGFQQYKLPNGKCVTIGKYDLDFFQKLQNLPACTKIQMMELTETEMQDYIDQQKVLENTRLLRLLNQQWYWKETGDEATITPEMMPEVNMSYESILKACKSKKSLSLNQIRRIIDFFVNENSEVYNNELELNF